MNIELFNYFTTDNISGKKCTEKWLSKNNNNLYEKIINWCNELDILKNIEFKRKVYHYINNMVEIPVCLNCKVIEKYRDIRQGYQIYCSIKCSHECELYYNKWLSSLKKNNKVEDIINKRNNTILKKWNTLEEYHNNKYIDFKEIMLNKYGFENLFLTDKFKKERKETLKEKYGDEKWNNKEKTKNTRIYNGTQLDDNDSNEYITYKKLSINRTLTIYRNNTLLINPTLLKRGHKQYHIDHKFSLKSAFKHNLPMEIISHPCNLQMIWWYDNISKQDTCSITLNELLTNIINYEHNVEIKHSTLNESYKKENLIKVCKRFFI